MSVKISLEEYKNRFYTKYPNRVWLKFLRQEGSHFIVEDKFGICKVAKNHLLNGWMPSIRVAIDKNSYFINKAKNIHEDYYDYSKINYICDSKLITLICPKHGEFEITPHVHICGKGGCNKCGYDKVSVKNGENALGWTDSDWYNKALTSKNFDSFKCYIIRCYGDNEEFYKIGKTFRTLKDRFTKHKERMPYDYEIIKVFEFKELNLESAKEISKMERVLKNQNKGQEYIPKHNIRGKFECFKQINII